MRFFNESQSLEVSVRHYWLKITWKLGVDQDFKYKIPARNDHSHGDRSDNHLHKMVFIDESFSIYQIYDVGLPLSISL